jgi:hypothetical protein
MKTTLEFLNAKGNESIAAQIGAYDGPMPATGDTIYLDMGKKFSVVQRVFYYFSNTTSEMKVSLCCEPLNER